VDNAAVHLFHYHLVTSELRDVEARYIGKLGFDLIARYGRIADDHVTAEQGASWEQLDREGFRLRLSELQRGARRTFVSTNAGYRLEVHPPREWIDELLEGSDEFRLDELQVKVDRPEQKAGVLADILGVQLLGDSVELGETLVRFLPGGPEGRPELYAERFA